MHIKTFKEHKFIIQEMLSAGAACKCINLSFCTRLLPAEGIKSPVAKLRKTFRRYNYNYYHYYYNYYIIIVVVVVVW